MSESEPDASSPQTWEEAHEHTVERLDRLRQRLDEYRADEHLEPPVRMLALLVQQSVLLQELTLMHVGSLERRLTETKALLRDFMKASMKLADVEEEIREHLEERLEQLEYANVTESQHERLKERLAGDVLDLIEDKMKGEEDAEDAPEDNSEDAPEDDNEDNT